MFGISKEVSSSTSSFLLIFVAIFVFITVIIGRRISTKSSLTLSHTFSQSLIEGSSVNAESICSLYLNISNSRTLNVFITSSAGNVLQKDSTTDFKTNQNAESIYLFIFFALVVFLVSDFCFSLVFVFFLLLLFTVVLFFLIH